MGLLRILLAISVLFSHAGGFFGFGMVGPIIAVQSFYIISGFYMSLILNEKYIKEHNSYWLFISNRSLRLYPIYWLMIAGVVLSGLIAFIATGGNGMGRLTPYITYFFNGNMSVGSFLFLVISNLVVLGQDVAMFLGFDPQNGSVYFAPHFSQAPVPLFLFLLLPQAWTVSLEIMFYLLAPFLVRRSLMLVGLLIVISFVLRIVLYSYGYDHDPWLYRFFPCELAYFLLGNISYRLYLWLKKHPVSPSVLKIIFSTFILLTLTYQWLPSVSVKMYAYFLVTVFAIPFLFVYTKDMAIDRYIGELSYPVYISHILVLFWVEVLRKYVPAFEKLGFALPMLVGSLLVSIVLNELVSKRIENIRQRRLKTKKARELATT